MHTARANLRHSPTLTLLAIFALHTSFTAFAQGYEEPAARAQEPVPAPAHQVRFGVLVQDYDNGKVQTAIVVGVYPNSPATRVRAKHTRPDGTVVYGNPTTIIRGDLVTRLIETDSGTSWNIQGVRDFIEAVQSLPPGAKFEISGYDADNAYKPYTAAAMLADGGGGGGDGDGDGDGPAESRRVRALLIADTDSGLPGLEGDLFTIRSMLEPLRQENRCSIDTLEGPGVNKTQILSWLNNQGNASQDTLFIYYCGHGATDMGADPDPSQRTLGHYLALTNGPPLFRSALRKGLAQHRPRLTILITESCSNVVPVAPAGQPPEMQPKLARSLFLRTRGIVDFTAATFDPRTGTEESAWTNTAGGIFTLSLGSTLIGTQFERLDKNADGLTTWQEVFPVVRAATDKEYKNMHDVILARPDLSSPKIVSAMREQPHQRPWAFSLDGR
jgi:hypothetical protein